jgi:heat shock protein HtpX
VGRRNEAGIAVTDGLLRGLGPRELTGVLAHELSHIANEDMWIMGLADAVSRLTSGLSLAGQILLLVNLPLLLLGQVTLPWLAVALLIAAPAVSALLQLALSRRREYDADLQAVRLTGDPRGLAAALSRLERYRSGWLGRVLLPGRGDPDPSLLRTHPATDERVRRLLELEREVEVAFPGVQQRFSLRDFPPVSRRPRWRVGGYRY